MENTKKTRRGKRGGKKNVPVENEKISETGNIQDFINESNENTAIVEKTSNVKRKRGKRGGAAKKETEKENIADYLTREPQNSQLIELPALQHDIRNYLYGIENKLKEADFEDDEDREIFLQNVYKEVEGHEVEIAGDPQGSRIFEILLRISNDFHMRVLLSKLMSNFEQLSCHQFASHVCDTILTLAADIIHREILGESVVQLKDEDDVQLDKMQDQILLLCDELAHSWPTLFKHRYGSHVLRTLITVLSGDPITDEKSLRSKKSKKYQQRKLDTENLAQIKVIKNRKTPDSFKEKLENICKQIKISMDSRSLRKLALDPVASPVLQLLISTDSEENIIKSILFDENADVHSDFVQALITDKVGSHLMEKILRHMSAQTYHQIYTSCFRGKIVEYCQDSIANFVVQGLLDNVKSKVLADLLMEELFPEFNYLIKFNRAGVIVKLGEVAMKFGSFQKEYFKQIMTFLGLSNSDRKDLVKLLLNLGNKSEDFKTSLHGSLILQKLFHFSSDLSHVVMDSLISTDSELVQQWMKCPTGSRCIEEALKSETINVKLKWKFIKTLAGKYCFIGKDKYGSHILDNFWAVSDINLKQQIADELLEHKLELSNSHFGKFVLRNCKIEQYGRKKDEWLEIQSGKEKKKSMFDEIIKEAELNLKNKGESIVLDPIFFPQRKEKEEEIKIDSSRDKKTKKRKVAIMDDTMESVLSAISATRKKKKNSDE